MLNRRNPKNKKTAFLFGFPLIIVWISQILSKIQETQIQKLAKSKQKICFLLFEFHIFYTWISRIFVWISPVLNFLGRQSKQKLYFVWISPRSKHESA
jgi:hypothetical protein